MTFLPIVERELRVAAQRYQPKLSWWRRLFGKTGKRAHLATAPDQAVSQS